MNWMKLSHLLLLGSILYATPALGDSELLPGGIGVFGDEAGSLREIWSDGYNTDLYLIARPGPLSERAFRFTTVKVLKGMPYTYATPEPVLPTTFYDVYLGEGVQLLPHPDPNDFEFDASAAPLRPDGTILLANLHLFDFTASSEWDYGLVGFGGLEVLPTAAASTQWTNALPAGWLNPSLARETQWSEYNDIILIVESMYVVTAAPAEVDPGEVVSIPFCFYKKAYSPDDYWSSFARGIDERFFDTWTEERCQQFQDVEYCIDFSGLSATLEWDPDVLTLLEARLRPRTIASEMTLEIVDSSPGLLEIQVSGGTGFHVYDTVFELDFLASSIPQLTSIASSSTGTYGSSGGFSGFVDRAATPAWIRIGCEKGDVVDDDVLDDSDAQAVLDLLSGTMPMDDFAYCRADFDFDGEASPGDAVLMLREIDGLGDGAGSSMSCVDGTSILPWGTIGVEGAAGLELYLQYPDGSSLLSTSATHGLVSAQEIEPGIAKLVWATSNLGGVAFLPVFDVEVECMIDLDRSRAFDETGAEIPLGDCLLTDAPSSRWRTILRTPHPNPFNPRTTIAFELAESGGVKVEIVDARGRRIRRLFVGDLEQGPHELVWDGRDDAGASAASGVYRVLLQTPEGVRSRPAVLLK